MLPMMFGGNKKASCCDDKKDENKSVELSKSVE
jgi:hypothetical protein